MTFIRFGRLAVLTSAACVPIYPAAAQGEGYPKKPIQMICPGSAGPGQSVMARRLAERVSGDLGRAMVIDNVPGVGGVIATEALIKALAAGYTISSLRPNNTAFANLYSKLRSDAVKDITSVSGSMPTMLAISAKFRANDVADPGTLAKQAPNNLAVGPFANDTFLHLLGSYMGDRAGINSPHFPFKGAASIMEPEVARGPDDIGVFAHTAIRGLVESGKRKVSAVSQRVPNASYSIDRAFRRPVQED